MMCKAIRAMWEQWAEGNGKRNFESEKKEKRMKEKEKDAPEARNQAAANQPALDTAGKIICTERKNGKNTQSKTQIKRNR